MGISGLLPKLGSIQRRCHIKEWSGKTVGVDAYSWLHKGIIGCAIELAQGVHSRKYVEYAMSRVHMLRYFGVTPYLVFDGDYLPSKIGTEAEREKRRQESRVKGLELLNLRKMREAQEQLQKSIDVTPLMARHLIDECREIGVQCIVAPYEADAQMYYLEKIGMIDGVVSEDSDLLAFGCKKLITKMDKFGECLAINRDDFTAVRGSGFSLAGWTDTEFRYMCILSGCDYLPNIANLGLVRAYRLVNRHKTPERIIQSVRFDATKSVPVDYLDGFRRANLTFLHQWVFCPKADKMVMVSEPDAGVDQKYLDGCGKEFDAAIARGVARGSLDPLTKKPFVLDPIVENAIRTADMAWVKPKMKAAEAAQTGRSITDFFKTKSESPKTPLQEKSANITRSEPRIKSTTPLTNKRLFSQFETKTDGPIKKSRLAPSNELENFNMTGERSSFFQRISRRSFSVGRVQSSSTPSPQIRGSPETDQPDTPKPQVRRFPKPDQPETPCSSGSSSSSSQKTSSFPTPESFSADEPIALQSEDEAISKVVQGLKSKYGFTSGSPASAPKTSLTERRQKARYTTVTDTAKKRTFSAPVGISQQIPHTEPMGDSSGESQDNDWPDFVGVRKTTGVAKEVAESGLARFAFKRG